MRRILRKYLYWNYLWLFLFAIGFGIYFIVTPKYVDDIWYMWDTKWWFDQQGIWYPNNGGNIFKYGIPWESIAETIRYHRGIDTERLGNMLAPILLLFPKWVVSILGCIAFYYTVLGCFKLAGVDKRKSWLVVLGIALWILTFPWYNPMGTVIYQCNYLISGFLCICLLFLIKRRPSGILGMTGFILLCIITALWHEGFTAPLAVSLFTVFVCFKNCRNRWILLACVIMILGMIWHFSGTGTMGRASGGLIGIDGKRLFRHFYYQREMWVALLVMVIYIKRFGFRSFFTNRLLVFMFSGTVTAFGLAYFSDFARAAWWGGIASVVMTLYMIRKIERFSETNRGWRLFLSICLLLISFGALSALDIHTVLFAKEYPKMLRNYIDHPEKSQFSSLLDYPWVSLPMLQMVYPKIYSYTYFVENYYKNYGKKGKDMKVVPASLRKIRLEDCKILDSDYNLMRYGDHIVALSKSLDKYELPKCDIDYGWFSKYRALECIPFVSEADGRRYVYVMPLEGITEYCIGDFRGVHINKNKKE